MERRSGTLAPSGKRCSCDHCTVPPCHCWYCVCVQREAESKAKVIESRCAKRLAVSCPLTGLLFDT